jgi:D-3-phosphoglycerate dehydrogenase
LRALLSAVIGIEGFDLAEATARGVVVGNARPFETIRGMSEATVLMMLAALYRFDQARDLLRCNLPPPSARNAHMLHGHTVGFLGYGRIAQDVAALIRNWGAQLQFYDVLPLTEPYPFGARRVDLDTLLRSSDVVSVHATLTSESYHLLNRERLRLMKSGAILVNVARGAIIDEEALCEVLRDGWLAGAALDVFEIEPLPAASPLRNIPNAVLTPHKIGHTLEAEAALARVAYENVTRVLSGRPPLYVVNPEVLPAWTRKWGHPNSAAKRSRAT